MDVFEMVADERRALADVLDELRSAQLSAPSLCHRWRVHDVAAHVVMVLQVKPAEFLRTLMLARGSFDRANDKLTARWAANPSARLAADLRRLADSRFTPPGQGPEAPLTDLLVHHLDIRRPLGIKRDTPPERLGIALRFLVAFKIPPGAPGPTLVPRGCLDGLRLEADDLDFGWGRGALVLGSAEDLMLAVTGRGEGVRHLRGGGAATLARRLR
ncbi:maleylpyruvate isomerase family mycothiol-dependent enzyme [Actinocrinis puniceicyclus]|uniref:Maleylpyruvate isomerase family mycothiol-dependent enzyme n=1 Tax=Actinocrinis puniceicyclus TaxID=977794 RepID=A0A8J7WLM8_9ACTN|nr:maleylpyruvate isomerase family mycothiol-dependent enzyme [Actinocrinis puniceicyclus]MBS2964631.1 maleylpyruvate isomerase family mycothiol-dependent enzyme [Actinocrinis puniceicyclus]